MTYRYTLLTALLLAAVVFSGCEKREDAPATAGPGASSDAVGSKENRSEPPRPVRFIQVGMRSVGDVLILPGEIRPRFEQRYAFRVSGKIARRLVDVGQEVKADQVLATLDSQDVLPAINAQAAQVEVARSEYKLQQSELKWQKELREKGFSSVAALERQTAATEAAQSRLQAAQLELANAKNSLNFQTLSADNAGVVVGVDAEAGSVVAAGQSVVRIAQLGEKEIAVNVPERSVTLIRKATEIAVVVDAIPGKIYTARLRELAPAADSASRTYSARFAIANADEAVKFGMSATVRLELGSGQAIVVPNSALYTRDDTTRVWLVDRAKTTVSAVDVKIGESTSDGVTIVAGLKPGDLVVTAGANLLVPGQKVRLLGAPAGPAESAKSNGQL